MYTMQTVMHQAQQVGTDQATVEQDLRINSNAKTFLYDHNNND